jgi:TolB-like protein
MFWIRFRQRKIFRLALTYIVTGWVVVQVVSTVAEPLDLPQWILRSLIMIIVIVFPAFLLLTLSFESAGRVEVSDHKNVVENKIKSTEKSIAVLPFLNMNKDASHEYFADGITENILTQLASIENLKVISRTSIIRYKNTLKSVPEIAQELGVKYILEGSAQAYGEKVRISVQLIEAMEDRHLWAKAFDEDIRDIFSIQNLVAGEVVNQLKASIQPSERAQLDTIPTKNMEAYDLFLKGMHAMSVYTFIPGGWKQAENFFLQSIGKDPGFKQAYSYLSRVYSYSISWLGDLSPVDGYTRATKYLNESMKLGVSAQDYITMSHLEVFINKDFKKGIALALQAHQLSSNDSEILYLQSYWLSTSGRFKEGLAVAERAMKIDPVSVSAFNYRGIALYLAGNYNEAIAVFRQSIVLHPLSLRQYDHLAKIYLTVGQYKTAEEVLNLGFAHSSYRPPSMVAYLAIAYWRLDETKKASKLINELTQRNTTGEKGTAVFIAQYFAETGDQNNSLMWLERSFQLNDVELFWIKVEPLFRNVRETAEFRKLAETITI